MIETNRLIYREGEKVGPIMVKATQKPQDAVEFAWDSLTRNCIWGVNEGFDPKRTEFTVNMDVAAGDIEAAKKPSFDQVVDMALAKEAVEAAGGRATSGNCKDKPIFIFSFSDRKPRFIPHSPVMAFPA